MTAGRPTELDDELTAKIRQLKLKGKSNKDVQALLDISTSTWEGWYWRNYKGFADSLLSYKHEMMINKAEKNIEEYLEMSTQNMGMNTKGQLYEYHDPKLEAIKADMTQFVGETLGRRNYHKKHEQENTGAPTTIIIQDVDGTPPPGLVQEPTPPVAEENNTGVE